MNEDKYGAIFLRIIMIFFGIGLILIAFNNIVVIPNGIVGCIIGAIGGTMVLLIGLGLFSKQRPELILLIGTIIASGGYILSEFKNIELGIPFEFFLTMIQNLVIVSCIIAITYSDVPVKEISNYIKTPLIIYIIFICFSIYGVFTMISGNIFRIFIFIPYIGLSLYLFSFSDSLIEIFLNKFGFTIPNVSIGSNMAKIKMLIKQYEDSAKVVHYRNVNSIYWGAYHARDDISEHDKVEKDDSLKKAAKFKFFELIFRLIIKVCYYIAVFTYGIVISGFYFGWVLLKNRNKIINKKEEI